MNLTEKLHELDKKGFDLYCENYDFEALYESVSDTLSSEDKQKLKNFISTTDDPEEVNIFMKGLLMEETPLTEDVEIEDNLTVGDLVDDINTRIESIKDGVNNIITTANQNGLDVLRNSADLAVGALDDFIKYMSDVQEAARQEEISIETPVGLGESLEDIDNYTSNFFEYYPTPQDFEDATGLEYTKENIKDVVLDWVKKDLNDKIQDPIKIATSVAEKVIEE